MPAYFGLDIGSSSIKLLQLKQKRVTAVGITANPIGKGEIDVSPNEKEQLAEAVRKLVKESGVKTRSVVLSMPESQVFSRVMLLPVMSSPELASAIKWELDQVVPFPPDKIEVSWVILEKPKRKVGNEKMRVFVVAVPKKTAEAYVNFLSLVGLEPVRVENEILSLMRSMIEFKELKGINLVVDIGANTTKMLVGSGGQVYVSHVVSVAGMAMTRMIAEAFKIAISQAEEYKRVYGVDKSQVEGKIFSALSGLIDSLVMEINKVVANFNNTNQSGGQVERLILTGGGAYLKGLTSLLVSKTNMDVVIGDAFEGLEAPEKVKGLGVVFAAALGLAINE